VNWLQDKAAQGRYCHLRSLASAICSDWHSTGSTRPNWNWTTKFRSQRTSHMEPSATSTTVTGPVGERLQAGTEDAPVLDRPAPLRRLHDSGARYKYPYLFRPTYLQGKHSLRQFNNWKFIQTLIAVDGNDILLYNVFTNTSATVHNYILRLSTSNDSCWKVDRIGGKIQQKHSTYSDDRLYRLYSPCNVFLSTTRSTISVDSVHSYIQCRHSSYVW